MTGQLPGAHPVGGGPYADPPLRSVSLNVTAAKFSSAFYRNGAPGLQNALAWTGVIGRQEKGAGSAHSRTRSSRPG